MQTRREWYIDKTINLPTVMMFASSVISVVIFCARLDGRVSNVELQTEISRRDHDIIVRIDAQLGGIASDVADLRSDIANREAKTH